MFSFLSIDANELTKSFGFKKRIFIDFYRGKKEIFARRIRNGSFPETT